MDADRNRRPFVVQRGEPSGVWSLGGHFTTKLEGEATEGRFAVLESVAFRTSEPPFHVHHREDEAWYVLEGQMTFVVGDETLVAPAGSFCFAPRGLPHAFTIDVEPTRVLVFASPGGFEHFAAGLGIPALNEIPPADLAIPPPEILGPVAERYGIEVVGPPLRVMRGET